MKQRVIRYTSRFMISDEITKENYEIDEGIYPYWHVIGAHDDYTACGHVTAEYNTEEKNGYPTCPSCIYTVKFYKKIKLQTISEENMGKTKIVAIFFHHEDRWTRAKTFDNWEELNVYEEKWKEHRFLVVAFKAKAGEFLVR